MFIQKADIVQVNHVMFQSNEAPIGGAVFIVAVEDKTTLFSECAFEGNSAADGGAVYLNTGPGLDIFTGSIFRHNYASESQTCPLMCDASNKVALFRYTF